MGLDWIRYGLVWDGMGLDGMGWDEEWDVECDMECDMKWDMDVI